MASGTPPLQVLGWVLLSCRTQTRPLLIVLIRFDSSVRTAVVLLLKCTTSVLGVLVARVPLRVEECGMFMCPLVRLVVAVVVTLPGVSIDSRPVVQGCEHRRDPVCLVATFTAVNSMLIPLAASVGTWPVIRRGMNLVLIFKNLVKVWFTLVLKLLVLFAVPT